MLMPDLLHTRGPTAFGTASSGGRNYDYTKIYNPDKQGEEAKENARAWNVYLDEAENYDADMIQGFRNIINGLLVFAALFSAVVTAFVAQTSQALQPDNAQIMVSLLVENNQLLRAAGNFTSISTVPVAVLGPGSRTHTSIDVWVNGLFFTSLALSLSTALLTVLAKQWIQAYTAVVPGGAKTRALIRHFRFQGLMKWKLSKIIESLPLILHGSVVIFLIGLALYVSRLSTPICAIVSHITALTFLFYFGTSMIPAFDIACPYRIPFMFPLARLLVFAFRVARCAFLSLWYRLTWRPDQVIWSEMPGESLKVAEHSEVFIKSDILPGVADHLDCDSLDWVFDHSSNRSVKEVVVEGACGLLNEWSSKIKYNTNLFEDFISSSENSSPFLLAVKYSLSQLLDMSSTSTTEAEVEKSTYGRLIGKLMKISSRSLLNTDLKHWREKIEALLMDTYKVAVIKRYHALSRRLLDWGYPNLLQSRNGTEVLFYCAQRGDGGDMRYLLDRGMDHNHRGPNGWTALHHAAVIGNLEGVIALVDREPALVIAKTQTYPTVSATALDLAVGQGHRKVVAYLLDRGANPPSNAVHIAVQSYGFELEKCLAMVEVLMDRGMDRTAEDAGGLSPSDYARILGLDSIAEHLEHYQTVRLPPYHTMPLIPNGEET